MSLAVAGCGGDSASGGGDCTVSASASLDDKKFVLDTLVMPPTRSDYALDLNGDGKADNQLGNIVNVLAGRDLNPQPSVDKAIAAGSLIVLVDAKSSDPMHAADSCTTTTVGLGKSVTPPVDFSGAGTFAIDPMAQGGSFTGRITNSIFTANPSVTSTNPVTIEMKIPLVAGSDPIDLKVVAAQVKFKYEGTKLTGGQLNGAIKVTDVNTIIVPKVAELLNHQIDTDPSGSAQVVAIFDTGGDGTGPDCPNSCENPDKTCGIKGNHKIDVCEVATSPVIKGVLKGDVQLYDASGNYKPSAANATPDSLSIGLGFTAVKGTF
jgi:hypothetical protein